MGSTSLITAVPTTSGFLRGAAVAPTVSAFLGIPYAESPVGRRRFAAPALLSSSDSNRDCTRFAGSCPQIDLPFPYLAPIIHADRASADEATCLNLNVWTGGAAGDNRPVMVFLHGGGFSMGASSLPMYDGATFASSGVVYVSVNYRVGPLGWLYLADQYDATAHTGNLGLLDQIAALHWVQENIAGFGGDPENVTIFGESAGGFSVATLLATPASRGLFGRAIVQSGSGTQSFSTTSASRVTSQILHDAGLTPGDWEALRDIDPLALADAELNCWGMAPELFEDECGGVRVGGLPFSPIVDGVTLPEVPEAAVRRGSAAGVELLIGTCANEYKAFLWDQPAEVLYEQRGRDLADLLEPASRTHEQIVDVYARDRGLTDDMEVLSAVATDAIFAIPSARLALNQARHARTFMYRLEWQTPVDDYRHGTPHAIDVPLVFNHLDQPYMHGDQPPAALASEMHQAWVRFATAGDPNGGALPDWHPYDESHRAVMRLNEVSQLGTDFSEQMWSLWGGADLEAATQGDIDAETLR